MPTYEYLAAELVGTQQVITTLPLTDVKFGSVLNGAGPITAKLKFHPLPPVTTDALTWGVELVVWGGDQLQWVSSAGLFREQNRIWKDATDPARRCVYVLRDGVVAAAYVWWTRSYDPATQTMDLGGAELWSLFRRRRITWEAGYSLADQLDIARDIVTRAMAVGGGDLDVALDADDSGKLRDRTFFDYEAKPVAEAVEQLAAVIDGFDFHLGAALVDGTVGRALELDYPRRGRTAANSGHVFAWGRNITDLTWTEDATSTANSIIGLGQGEGLSKVRTRLSDTSAYAEGYPLLEDSISFSDVQEIDTLTGHVNAELAQRSRPITLPQVTVLGDSDPPLGSYILGDDCHLVIPADVDPFWPDGITTPRRIHAIDVTPPDGAGVEVVKLTLGEAIAGV